VKSHFKLAPDYRTTALRIRNGPHRPARTDYWPTLYMFAFGFGWALAIELQFRLYLAELIVLMALPFLSWKSLITRYGPLIKILSCLGLWFTATLLSDLYNQTDLNSTLRGLSTPLLAVGTLLFILTCIDRKPSSLMALLMGSGLGKMIFGEPFYGLEWSQRAIDFNALSELNYFKARIEPFLTPILILFLSWIGRKNAKVIIIPACIIGFLYILFDARSVGFAFFTAGVLFFVTFLKRRPSVTVLWLIAILFGCVSYAFYVAYVDYTLSDNMASQTGMQLSMVANPYNPLELLQIGRSEWAAMPTAIAERPLMGWGSWALDTSNRFNLIRLERTGALNLGSEQLNGLMYIPAHSVIGAAWMWSGLLGLLAIVWLFIVFTQLAISAARQGIAAPSKRTAYLFITLFLSVNMAWAFIFSPPQSVRTQFPIVIALLIYMTTQKRQQGRLSFIITK
jgi:hypothetical protein